MSVKGVLLSHTIEKQRRSLKASTLFFRLRLHWWIRYPLQERTDPQRDVTILSLYGFGPTASSVGTALATMHSSLA